MSKVRACMTSDIEKVSPDTPLEEVIKIMRGKNIGSVLIEEGRKIVGIFTERDVLKKVDPGSNPKTPIKDLMTKDPDTVPIDEIYAIALDRMQEKNIRHMPVTEQGETVGIVSIRDLMRSYYMDLEKLLEETVASLSYAVEKRDPYTAGHQKRVAQLATALANELDLPKKQVSGISLAAIIHDIGKMYVPAEILNKPGILTDPEITLIKIHPQVGYDILKDIEFPWPIAEIVLQHHEKIDGSGYPNGLKGEDFLFDAQIVAMADIVEAMSTHRPYRPSLGIDKALMEILQKKGELYAPVLVDACLRLFQEKNFEFDYSC